jgi:hypothetical protein
MMFKLEMIFMKNMKKEEIDFNSARTLSKVNSTKKESRSSKGKPSSTDVRTGHGNPETGNSKKEIGPGGQVNCSLQFSVYGFQS